MIFWLKRNHFIKQIFQKQISNRNYLRNSLNIYYSVSIVKTTLLIEHHLLVKLNYNKSALRTNFFFFVLLDFFTFYSPLFIYYNIYNSSFEQIRMVLIRYFLHLSKLNIILITYQKECLTGQSFS